MPLVPFIFKQLIIDFRIPLVPLGVHRADCTTTGSLVL